MGAVPLSYFGRQPAWHGVGTIMDVDKTAREALAEIRGYEVVLEELTTSSGIVVPQRAIVRKPTKDDPESRVFGVVGPEYELIGLEDAVEIWDHSVKRPIETMGLLGKHGENFFCTTKLPTMGVRGEEIRNYLLFNSPMDGFSSAYANLSPVCTVCENTLALSKQMALQQIKIVHDATAKARLAEWMGNMVETATAQLATLKEAFDIFAKHKVTIEERTAVLDVAYPDGKTPVRNAPDEVMKTRWENYDYYKGLQEKARAQVIQLFDGEMTGFELKGRKGTLWGLYNAVTERENYRRGGSQMSRAASIINIGGTRQTTMELAFGKCLEIVGRN